MSLALKMYPTMSHKWKELFWSQKLEDQFPRLVSRRLPCLDSTLGHELNQPSSD